MQTAKVKAEALGRKAKVRSLAPALDSTNRVADIPCSQLAQSYQGLLEYVPQLAQPLQVSTCADSISHSEFSNKDLKSVGNYTLGRLIGKGSFGKVYLATHKLTNGSKACSASVLPWWKSLLIQGTFQVVLKSANKDDSNLAREIHHHRQFVHPHIARLYEVIVTETLVWLVLEYCPGMTKLPKGEIIL